MNEQPTLKQIQDKLTFGKMKDRFNKYKTRQKLYNLQRETNELVDLEIFRNNKPFFSAVLNKLHSSNKPGYVSTLIRDLVKSENPKQLLEEFTCRYTINLSNIEKQILLTEVKTLKNTNLQNIYLPSMPNYYQEFNDFFESKIKQIRVSSELKPNLESQEKTKQVCQVLWRYDLRRGFNVDLYYQNIIENILNSLAQQKPVQLVQFACTKRGALKDLDRVESSIITSSEGSNLLPNLPFLKVIKQELDALQVPNEIVVLFADSENYWVDFCQGKGLKYDLLSNLEPIWNKACSNLIQTVDETVGESGLVSIVQTSVLEKQFDTQFGLNFQSLFEQNLEYLYKKFPIKLVARMALVWQNVANGNQSNAFSDAEEIVNSDKFNDPTILTLKDLSEFIDPVYIDKAISQLTEYPIQGYMLELFYPNAILLQNERPFGSAQYGYKDGKNYFYNIDLSLRKRLLPEIAPYFYV